MILKEKKASIIGIRNYISRDYTINLSLSFFFSKTHRKSLVIKKICRICCFDSAKIQILKAIHNLYQFCQSPIAVVLILQKYKF